MFAWTASTRTPEQSWPAHDEGDEARWQRRQARAERLADDRSRSSVLRRLRGVPARTARSDARDTAATNRIVAGCAVDRRRRNARDNSSAAEAWSSVSEPRRSPHIPRVVSHASCVLLVRGEAINEHEWRIARMRVTEVGGEVAPLRVRQRDARSCAATTRERSPPRPSQPLPHRRRHTCVVPITIRRDQERKQHSRGVGRERCSEGGRGSGSAG